jgi:DNA-binding transcriptional LysR family regulator
MGRWGLRGGCLRNPLTETETRRPDLRIQRSLSGFPELRLADLVTLLAVQRTGSISGAAREMRVTPSQVSKAMARLERHFGVRLLSRGARGVVATPAGRHMLPRIANAIQELRATTGLHDEQAPAQELTVAGPSYLIANVLPAMTELLPRTRVRSIELAPAVLRSRLAENVFDVALSPGPIDNRPAAWTTDGVGAMRMALFARPAYAERIGPLPLTAERVRALPFIGPAKMAGDRFVALYDDCPLSSEERWIAHEAQTIGSALEFASRTDHVVFGPNIAARRFIETGAVVEVPVAGWDVSEPLHVLCNGDRVLSRARTALVQAAQGVLAAQN